MNTNRTYASSAYRATLAAGLAALALIFSYIEAIIPFNAGMPGVKLGIANLVILVSLYTLGFRYTFAINLVRILVAGLFVQRLFRSAILPGRRDSQPVCHVWTKKNRSFSPRPASAWQAALPITQGSYW